MEEVAKRGPNKRRLDFEEETPSKHAKKCRQTYELGKDVMCLIFSYLVDERYQKYALMPLICKDSEDWYRQSEKKRIELFLQGEKSKYQVYMGCIWSFLNEGFFDRLSCYSTFGAPFSSEEGKYEGLTLFPAEKGYMICPTGWRVFNVSECVTYADHFFSGWVLRRFAGGLVWTKEQRRWWEFIPDNHIVWTFLDIQDEKRKRQGGAKRGSLTEDRWFWFSDRLPEVILEKILGDANLKSQMCQILRELNKAAKIF